MRQGPETSSAIARQMIETLAAAFSADPVVTWLLPADRRGRETALLRYFQLEIVNWGLPRRSVYRSEDNESVAIWYPPDRAKVSNVEVIRALPAMVRCLGRRTGLAAQGISMIEKERPSEPHWYLHGLGTRPEKQRLGLGAKTLAPVLEIAAGTGVGCYLEASNPANVPYYQRFGFEVRRSIRLPKGPEVWLMWRPPA